MCSSIQNQLEKINLKEVYRFILLDFTSQRKETDKVNCLVMIVLTVEPINTFYTSDVKF